MRRGMVLAAFACCGGLLLVPQPTTGLPPANGWWGWLQADPERGLLLVATVLGWLLAGWLFMVTGLALAATSATASGRAAGRVAQPVTPAAVRRVLEAALGVALAVGPAGSAMAGPSAPPSRSGVTLTALAPVPAPIVAPPELPLPDLDRPLASTPTPPGATAPAKPRRRMATRPAVADRTVVPGDTLWGLAEGQLPSGASPADITRAWQQWYALNRATIGPDPGLLLPGERLSSPELTS